MLLQILFYGLFFLSALFLIVIVLVQEGKGGGLTDAFGGAGQETFGVRAGGINRFTFGIFAVFVLSALMLHWTYDADAGSVMGNEPSATSAPGTPGETPIPGQ